MRGYIGLNVISNGGTLSEATRVRIALAVSEQNGSLYCVSEAMAQGGRAGLTRHEMVRARAGTSEEAKADVAVRFATLVLETSGNVSDEELDRLRWAGYSDAEVIEIIAHVAMSFFANMAANVTRVETDEVGGGVRYKHWEGSFEGAAVRSVGREVTATSDEVIGA